MKRLSLDEAIIRAKQIHGNKFDYSKAIYVNSKIKLVCPVHGSFWQTLSNHLTKKHGCNLCSPTLGSKLTQEQYIAKCINKHNGKYNYSKVVFTGVKNKITIICPIHNEFHQIAEKHFLYGCSSCAGNKRKSNIDFITQASNIHKSYYKYNNTNYKSSNNQVIITCPIHGDFKQIAKNHLKGQGCYRCNLGNSSKIENIWLDYIGLPDDSSHRNVLLKVNNRKIRVDGYIPGSNVVFEFLGDYWHGNPNKFNHNDLNLVTKKTFGVLFNNTVERIKFLRSNNFKVISIWESKFKNVKNINDSRISCKSRKNTRNFG